MGFLKKYKWHKVANSAADIDFMGGDIGVLRPFVRMPGQRCWMGTLMGAAGSSVRFTS